MTLAPAHRRKAGCPSDLDLDEILSGDLAGDAREAILQKHIEHCATCSQRLERRQADPVLAPDRLAWRPVLSSLANPVATQDSASGYTHASARAAGIPSAPVTTGRYRVLGLSGAGALAAAAAITLLISSHRVRPTDEASSSRTKGALALTVHIRHPSTSGSPPTLESVNGAGKLRAGDEFRFSIVTAQPGFAVILGLDAVPSVTCYVPVVGGLAAPIPVNATRSVILPGSVIADETPGFERIVAVVCPTAIPPESLRQKAEAALSRAGGLPEAVAALGTSCLESSVLLRKTPSP
jgi:hypothetical protein